MKWTQSVFRLTGSNDQFSHWQFRKQSTHSLAAGNVVFKPIKIAAIYWSFRIQFTIHSAMSCSGHELNNKPFRIVPRILNFHNIKYLVDLFVTKRDHTLDGDEIFPTVTNGNHCNNDDPLNDSNMTQCHSYIVVVEGHGVKRQQNIARST